MTLRKDCKGILLGMIGDSKLPLVILASCYRENIICQINSAIPGGHAAIIICSNKDLEQQLQLESPSDYVYNELQKFALKAISSAQTKQIR